MADWTHQTWRKQFVAGPGSWVTLPALTRGIGYALLSYVDDSGRLHLRGEEPGEVVARVIQAHRSEAKAIATAVGELLSDGYLTIESGHLVITNFELAQGRTEAQRSKSAERQKAYRDRNALRNIERNADHNNDGNEPRNGESNETSNAARNTSRNGRRNAGRNTECDSHAQAPACASSVPFRSVTITTPQPPEGGVGGVVAGSAGDQEPETVTDANAPPAGSPAPDSEAGVTRAARAVTLCREVEETQYEKGLGVPFGPIYRVLAELLRLPELREGQYREEATKVAKQLVTLATGQSLGSYEIQPHVEEAMDRLGRLLVDEPMRPSRAIGWVNTTAKGLFREDPTGAKWGKAQPSKAPTEAA